MGDGEGKHVLRPFHCRLGEISPLQEEVLGEFHDWVGCLAGGWGDTVYIHIDILYRYIHTYMHDIYTYIYTHTYVQNTHTHIHIHIHTYIHPCNASIHPYIESGPVRYRTVQYITYILGERLKQAWCTKPEDKTLFLGKACDLNGWFHDLFATHLGSNRHNGPHFLRLVLILLGSIVIFVCEFLHFVYWMPFSQGTAKFHCSAPLHA